MTRFLQWNIRGLQANMKELDVLLSLVHPSVICLQETFLRESKKITFKGFSSYQKPAQEVNAALHGGSAILVNSSTPHRQLDLHTGLQVVAICISCQKTDRIFQCQNGQKMPWKILSVNFLLLPNGAVRKMTAKAR